MGELLDNPNQQVVREDGSGPGLGGPGPDSTDETPEDAAGELDSMTKAQLLEHAVSLGISPANNDMTKQELRDAIEAHQG